MDFQPYFAMKNDIYTRLWEDYGVDSLHAYGDYDEALALGTACGGATAFSYSLAKRDFIDECLAQLKGE